MINLKMTAEINCRIASLLGTHLTDAFCGFKAHRVDSLRELALTETGYAFPMQFWVQAAAARLRVREMPVARIYHDLSRTFGGTLDDPERRLRHYQAVLRQELRRQRAKLPADAFCDDEADSHRCGCGPSRP
jgi:dolichol-phosphate mannosyltransferase